LLKINAIGKVVELQLNECVGCAERKRKRAVDDGRGRNIYSAGSTAV
jgi:hypothetical protein